MKFRIQIMIIGLLLLNAGGLNADGMQAYFADFTNPAVLSDVDSMSAAVTVPPAYAGCASTPPNVVFGVNFTSGLAYRDGVLYGLEWENGNGPAIFLYSYAADNCATGTRVGGATGHTNLESLAYCEADGFFYSVDFDFDSPHLGQLVRIDPATGVGTLIGNHMTFDVRIVGMVCDPQGQLWAVSSGFATRNPELLKVNRTTGVETLVGELSLPANEVESLAIDPEKPGQLFAAGKALYEVNKSTGAAVLVGGSFNQFWAMAGIPASSAFLINAAITDAWFFPATSGQGFFIIVWEDSKLIFLSWFTYDTELPPQSVTAFFGAPGQRWLTALGSFDGDTALLDVFLSSGMIFDSAEPPVTTEQMEGATIEIVWTGCNAGVVKYNIPSLGLSGEIPIERIVLDNVPACEAAQS